MGLKVAVLASGRGSNLEALLAAAGGDYQVSLVISDRQEARALAVAREAGCKALWKTDGAEIANLIEAEGCQLVALAGYMRLVRGELLQRFTGRIMNIHPSLLPSFPGLNAPGQALAYGVKVSGCTVHFVDAGMDTGPVILQSCVPVLEDDTEDTLAARILVEEHRLYPRAVSLYARGHLRLEGRRVIILP